MLPWRPLFAASAARREAPRGGGEAEAEAADTVALASEGHALPLEGPARGRARREGGPCQWAGWELLRLRRLGDAISAC